VRIEDLRVTPIALGDPPLLNASGLHAPYALRIVLELTIETGETGLSEIPGDEDVLQALLRLRHGLRGRSALDRHAIRRVLRDVLREEPGGARGDASWDQRRLVHIESALEVASLDAQGHRLGCRVADLLGGVVRDRVPYAGYLFFKYAGAGGPLGFGCGGDTVGWATARQREALDAAAIVAQALAMVDAFGFGSLKLKAGSLPPEAEVDTILALRETFGADIPLRIDPNAVWSFDTALRVSERLRGAIEYLEDPVRGQAEMARLRRALDIPLATNMCTTSFDDLRSSVAFGSEDIILVDHHFWGGLRASMDLASVTAMIGRELSMHSNSHAGISFAAMTHLGAALPSLRYAADTHYPWQEDEIIVGGKLPITDGCVTLPDGPGLGVTLDRAALARAHERYVACGLVRRDDEIEMQKKQPGWRFQATRY
jgi:glucarate dehydratase